ncbi:MAG: 16S rRNA (adenine(1518)-N(6)/adenine(1519)-N(6)) -dimethyltransferase RsmA [Candidatus Caldatribacteriota bacterium]
MILSSLDLDREDYIFEIGSGVGTLTAALAPLVKKVVSVEKDKRLFPVLKESLNHLNNIELISADIMNLDLATFLQERRDKGERIEKIVGNLPYYISLALIGRIIELKKYLKVAVFLVQKEVADRLFAKAGSKEYGILSVLTQYYAKPEKIHLVPPTVFFPAPQVNSMLVRINLLLKPLLPVGQERVFIELVKASFRERRKRLINSLTSYFSSQLNREKVEKVLAEIGINRDRRGETLTLEEFAHLSLVLQEKGILGLHSIIKNSVK